MPGDIFAAKGYLEALLGALRVTGSFANAPQPFLHPGRSAAVSVGGEVVGWVGDVHPLVAREWDLDAIAAFELDIGAVIAHAELVPAYEDLTSFPELREDIAVIVDDGVPAATVLETRARVGRAAARARRGLRRLPRRADPGRPHVACDRADVPRPPTAR